MSDKKKSIFITRPTLPDIIEFNSFLEKIWESKWLSNNGVFHNELEEKLKDYLNVNNITLASNGTLALMIGLKSLDLKGEVITTPFTYVATAHAIEWLGLNPVFCDINEDDYNINPEKIEALITENTSAIMPVHVYGNPCDHKSLNEICKKHNLKLIYDAAHCFDVLVDNQSVLNWGDLSVLSFHATKVFNTIEGGAVVSNSINNKKKLDSLRNFGFNEKNEIVRSGINAKMNEIQAAFGLMQLKGYQKLRQKREKVYNRYIDGLSNINGIILPELKNNVISNYSYFPVRITEDCIVNRDAIFDKLKSEKIYSRKYFYPLVSNMSPYKENPSSAEKSLPIANEVSNQILCLPIYEDLKQEEQNRIIKLINEFSNEKQYTV